MSAYYNEIDPNAAQWLRNLIAAGHIAPGDVDERSIEDVTPADLAGYTQCHFFAGIGVWSYALRLAGWPDDRPVWTGSCPCQPFSAAGKGDGFTDQRHLWPSWFHLIGQCRPPVLFGEQVASKDGLGWLDLVHSDLEGENYSCWPLDLCAAGIGAPHIRQRLWIIAESLEHATRDRREQWGSKPSRRCFTSGRSPHPLVITQGERHQCGERGDESGAQRTASGGGEKQGGGWFDAPDASRHDQLDNTASEGLPQRTGEALFGETACGERERSGDAGRLAITDLHQHREQIERLDRQPDGEAAGNGAHIAVAGESGRTSLDVFGGMDDSGGIGRGQSGDGHNRGDDRLIASTAIPDGSMADSQQQGRERRLLGRPDEGRSDQHGYFGCSGAAGALANASCGQLQEPLWGQDWRDGSAAAYAGDNQPSPINGHWRDADWLFCRDGKWRPVEAGTFPLANGVAGRVGRLRAYGNAIVAQVAQTVIETYLETESLRSVRLEKGVFE